MRLGNLDLHIASDGEFRLDGGAMFGVVPKVLWERHKPADERNRIRMTANCLLVESGDDLLLVVFARLREVEPGRFAAEPVVREAVAVG